MNPSRREFLAYAGIFGWFPWFRPKHVSVAGARFRIIRHGKSRRRYLLIHGNEETARAVLIEHMRNHHGKALIVEGHTRNVPIDSGEIDPNRMFSRVGAAASLRALNPKWPVGQVEAALNYLDRNRNRLLKELLPPPGGLLVALHNNAQYSVNDELANSDATSIREPSNPPAFFLCTDKEDFRRLAESAYNVVLQQTKPQQDDGSLSRLAAQRGIRYVNLEVRHGDMKRQQEMLGWLEKALPDYQVFVRASSRRQVTSAQMRG